ncbi:RNA polymerase sigma factor [Lignipirellula cremea]|nr:RNA polymerase sigma factor [Lignipirellula cremea]
MSPPTDLHRRLECWVREHGAAVRGYLLGAVQRVDLADDLLQEVFRKAFMAGDQYQEQGQARAWLMRIADRLLIDRYRKKQIEVNVGSQAWRILEPSAAHADPEAAMLAEESRQELAQALEHLSEAQRRVLLLRFYGDLGFAEIAETTGLPLNTVLSHCRRGLAALRKNMTEESP